MWVFATTGFYSAVEHREDPDRILVRARVKADLARLEEQVPGTRRRISRDDTADYLYRVELTRADWAKACASLALDVDYPNFKDAVTVRQGSRRAAIYHGVWGRLLALEKGWRSWGGGLLY